VIIEFLTAASKSGPKQVEHVPSSADRNLSCAFARCHLGQGAEVRYLEGMALRAGSTDISDRCSKHEANALSQLETEWPQFVGPDRSSCMVEATIGGFASYVELLACLEMARDARNSK
jgi:hypothetical protein